MVTNEGNFVTPIVVYDLSTPIHSKISNFNNFVSDIDIDQFLADPAILSCNCNKSPFVDKDHGHVLKGDLKKH